MEQGFTCLAAEYSDYGIMVLNMATIINLSRLLEINYYSLDIKTMNY